MPYARALFRRSLGAMVVLTALTLVTVITTDEATSTVGTRLARLAALSPLIVAVALLGVSGHARLRGELRALEALGTKPWHALSGAERAGLVVAVASLCVLVAPWTDATSLFPAVYAAVDWRLAADGMSAVAPGVVVHAGGAIEVTRASVHGLTSPVAARDALPFMAPIALLVPAWAATPMTNLHRIAAGVASCVLTVFGLHAVAALRLSPLFGVLACVPLALSLWRARA